MELALRDVSQLKCKTFPQRQKTVVWGLTGASNFIDPILTK